MIAPPIHRLPEPGLLIGDRKIPAGSGGDHEHIYAATGRPTCRVPLAGAADVDAAVSAAAEAFPRWRASDGRSRSRLLHAIGDAVERHAQELALVQTLETATPIAFSTRAAAIAAEHFYYNAGWADKIGGDVVPVGESAFDFTLDEPYGVVGIVVPWNAPLVSSCQVVASALAAGNTVVLKPPELAPFTAMRMAEIARDAGLPSGVINVVPGGPAAGDRLVRHPHVSKIHFTGRTETARKVIAASAENVVPLCLELGGKAPLLIFDDADLLAAAQHAMSAMVGLSGQGCALPTRALVQRAAADKFLLLVKGLARRVMMGDPLDEATQVGPLISADACERVLATIGRAREQGDGTMVMGGTRGSGELAEGYYVAPTIFTDVVPSSELAQEEAFGPVLAVTPFEAEDEALRLANDSRYGLAAHVFTKDLARAHRIGAGLAAGTVWINGLDHVPSMPFGGTALSGYGRLGGRHGIREFTRAKNVWLSVERQR